MELYGGKSGLCTDYKNWSEAETQRQWEGGHLASLLSELIFAFEAGAEQLSIAGLLVGRKEEAGEWTGLGLRTLLGSLANKCALFFFKSRPLSMTDLNNFKNHIC